MFLVLAASVFAIGTYYYRNYAQHYHAEVERQLSAVAELKVNQLVNWREGHMAVANVFHNNLGKNRSARLN